MPKHREIPTYKWPPESILEWTESHIKKDNDGKQYIDEVSQHYITNNAGDFFNIVHVLCKEIINRPKLPQNESELVNNLRYELSQSKGKITSLNSDLTRKEREITRLNSDLDRKKQEVTLLNGELDNPVSLWTRIQKFFFSSHRNLQEKQHKIDELAIKIRSFEEKLDKAEQEKKDWKSEYNRLDEKFYALQAQKAVENADRGKTSVRSSLSDTILQDYEVSPKYKSFCTKTKLAYLCEKVFSYLAKKDPSLREKRDFCIAQMTFSLSNVILMEVFNTLTTTEKFDFEAFFEAQKKKLFANISLTTDTKEGTELAKNIREVAENGFELVGQIINASPPGELWVEPQGKAFDEKIHDVALGCKKEGVINWTVIPGLRAGSSVLFKPIVFTEIQEK